ncbi:MAG: amylo-alpha-1,6-glucosidase [Pseudomonadota bacterium]
MISKNLHQEPEPGKRLLLFAGDTVTFRLSLDRPGPGRAWLRTNIGNARALRAEIIRQTEEDLPPLARDWRDLAMRPVSDGNYEITLPVCEPGHLEAKAFFLPPGQTDPLWPEGDNTVLNVKPACLCAGNSLYNAFVRQFGPNISGKGGLPPDKADYPGALDQAGWTAIPKSGSFRDLIPHLDFIIHGLGCRIIQLLPIHPTPTVYARMGRFGSPYAALSFFSVDPALAEFDPAATPLEQFGELVDAIHARGGMLVLDMAINHTGWSARIHETHPHWLKRDPDGLIHCPGAWGVTWADLTQLDYSHPELWRYMAEVFLAWCRRGVDGFRCDAGYMVPVEAWTYITARVRREFPETVFLLEGLGGKISVSRDLLNLASFDAAYSELFQNYDRAEIERYLPATFPMGDSDGIPFHFAETHDNSRLASVSPIWASMRTALCALFSPCGAFGFANGVEWLATEKIDVHEARSLNWGAGENQVEFISRLTRILDTHPCFFPCTRLALVQQDNGNHVVLFRENAAQGKKLLVAVNLDPEKPGAAFWDAHAASLPTADLTDLVSGKKIPVKRSGSAWSVCLGPGQVACLSPDAGDLAILEKAIGVPPSFSRLRRQKLRAMALEAFFRLHPEGGLDGQDPDALADALGLDPVAFLRTLNPHTDETLATAWTWPGDARREVMVPPGHFLLVRSPLPFRARLAHGDIALSVAEGLETEAGGWFALLCPPEAPESHERIQLQVTVYENGGGRTVNAPVLLLCPPEKVRVKKCFSRALALAGPLLALGVNHRGGMMRAHARFSELSSKYDALLAANLDPRVPEDRRVLFTRCQAWVVFQGYSRQLEAACLESFSFSYNSSATWSFTIPALQRQHVTLDVTARMEDGENAVRLEFSRQARKGREDILSDSLPVTLILRPDLEDRSFHETTKAFLGTEQAFPKAVNPWKNGFSFAPCPGHALDMELPGGTFHVETQWKYMVHRALEAERGMDPDSDLFSPGWFSTELSGGEKAVLTARVPEKASPTARSASPPEPDGDEAMEIALYRAMDPYLAKRDQGQTVIAGFPWFLDWGRDSLIFLRGLIASGRTAEARDILGQFARFEKNGTLPNMIRGTDAGDRDTSDAPLWFFVACGDLLDREGGRDFLEENCNGRSLRQVLLDMAGSIMDGTPNGVAMDPESGLVFSPAHFTWMDTNHPAGTPREGYPVEIQALWHAALSLLVRLGEKKPFEGLARQVRRSILERFLLKQGYLSDCLHAPPGTPASRAEPDDALRPNQLLAITLGAVDPKKLGPGILAACEELLVPGAIRSLADRPVSRPLPVVRDGQLINDPNRPYFGTYQGDEDSRRKPAYHNGTAWTWLFPSYAEAWVMAHGRKAAPTARAWLGSSEILINQGAAGHVPEITDGDAPHTPRGCDAQAWGVSELYRVWKLLSPGTRSKKER